MNFITHLQDAGIDHAEVDLNRIGVWQRVATTDKPDRRNGAIMIFSNRPLRAWFTNFATAMTGYFSDECELASPADLDRLERTRRDQRSQRERDHAMAAKAARHAWANAEPADTAHGYLANKRVVPHGVRQIGDHLLVPMCADGRIWSHQTIAPDGAKRFLAGGRKCGTYFGIGGAPTDVLLLCEGFATGASLFESLCVPVAVAFDAGNLVHVGVALRQKYPAAKFIFCGDNDSRTVGNPGVRCATEAATATNGIVVAPTFPTGADETALSDWNDYRNRYGAARLRACFAEVFSHAG